MANGEVSITVPAMAGAIPGTRDIPLRATFLFVKSQPLPLTYDVQLAELGSKEGSSSKQQLIQGDKIRFPVPFDRITLINTNDADVTVTLLIGDGDFSREVPDRIGSAYSMLCTLAQPETDAGGNPSVYASFAENPLRRRASIKVLAGTTFPAVENVMFGIANTEAEFENDEAYHVPYDILEVAGVLTQHHGGPGSEIEFFGTGPFVVGAISTVAAVRTANIFVKEELYAG